MGCGGQFWRDPTDMLLLCSLLLYPLSSLCLYCWFNLSTLPISSASRAEYLSFSCCVLLFPHVVVVLHTGPGCLCFLSLSSTEGMGALGIMNMQAINNNTTVVILILFISDCRWVRLANSSTVPLIFFRCVFSLFVCNRFVFSLFHLLFFSLSAWYFY